MRRIARTLVPALLAVALTAGCGGGGDSGSETTSSGESLLGRLRRGPRARGRGPRDLDRRAQARRGQEGRRRVRGRPGHQGGEGDLLGPADQLRDGQHGRQRPRRGRRRPRLDRQPGPERRDRPAPPHPGPAPGLLEKAVQATTYDDQLYGVPYGIEALGLYRNTEVAPDEPATSTTRSRRARRPARPARWTRR